MLFIQKIKQNPYLTSIVIFSLVLVAVNFLWIKKDVAPPPWDQAWYLENSQIIYHSWIKDGVWGLLNSFSHALNGVKAPLISILPLPFYLLLGNSEMAAMFVNFSFLILFSYFLFRLVKAVSNEKVAFLSVLITQTMPLFVGLNRQFLVEYGLATLVVMYLYFLIKSDYFQDKKCNTWLGLLLGFGLLMKIIFPLYVFFPSLWVVYLRGKNSKYIFEKSFIWQCVKILLIGFFVCVIWYVPNIKSVISFAFSVSIGDVASHYGFADIFSWDVIYKYWKSLVNICISSYYFVALLISFLFYLGCLIFCRRKEKLVKIYHKGVLLLWFFVPFAVFTFGVNKDFRYMLPTFPVIAIFISLMIFQLSLNIKRTIITLGVFILIIFYPFWTIYYGSFVDAISAENRESISLPDSTDWRTTEIVQYIHQEMYKRDNPSLWNIVAVDHPAMNYNTYSYIASTENYVYPVNFGNLGYNQEDFSEVLKIIDRAEPSFILVQDGISLSELPKWTNIANDEIREMLEKGELPYVEDRIFELSHGVKVTLFKRIP